MVHSIKIDSDFIQTFEAVLGTMTSSAAGLPEVTPLIFPREGRLWNFGGTHKIHKRFLTESTGSTWVGKEQRDNVETAHTHLF